MRSDLHALELWRHALVASVRGDAPDLSARQMALLLSVYMDDCDHTVRGLAKALNISKPAISRALDRLGELGYIRRERDDMDRRNVLVQRTADGGAFLREFSGLIVAADSQIESLPERHLPFLAANLEALQNDSAFDGDGTSVSYDNQDSEWPMAAQSAVDVAA